MELSHILLGLFAYEIMDLFDVIIGMRCKRYCFLYYHLSLNNFQILLTRRRLLRFYSVCCLWN